ncbi:AAA family ATPase [Chitinophaga sp. S165]|uniref:AAA family ATPase n=1 Tax=Chitinophaga sp. S165 TaxID=2135462 RepID=UPI000D71BB33|nr:AAA family ATPase [Chitinophaga sp. S165]PWV45023.1 putative ATPase [Chitinophaga sp. S165]
MLDKIRIRNFKSIDDLSIDLGRFNVFIGENGAGKSNILESMVFVSAAFNRNIENDFLSLRGARTSEAKLMRSGFDDAGIHEDIIIDIETSGNELSINFQNDNQPFSKWKHLFKSKGDELKDIRLDYTKEEEKIDHYLNLQAELLLKAQEISDTLPKEKKSEGTNSLALKEVLTQLNDITKIREILLDYIHKSSSIISELNSTNNKIVKLFEIHSGAADYIIFSPENFFLRNYSQEDNHVEPLGHKGEGLLKLVKIIKKEKPDQYRSIIESLSLVDWFDSFDISENPSLGETEFLITDKYLEEGLKSFDIRNANEGFFFILFYITLFTSDYTPSFFSIDNIDTALNPKLCSKLITVLSDLAVKNNKQVIITTHNPSVLDGLNLTNDEERLFVVSRNAIGNTRVNRIEKRAPLEGEQPVKLSEQFLRGYIGGLPKNF